MTWTPKVLRTTPICWVLDFPSSKTLCGSESTCKFGVGSQGFSEGLNLSYEPHVGVRIMAVNDTHFKALVRMIGSIGSAFEILCLFQERGIRPLVQ
jgi:hypothetical protein